MSKTIEEILDAIKEDVKIEHNMIDVTLHNKDVVDWQNTRIKISNKKTKKAAKKLIASIEKRINKKIQIPLEAIEFSTELRVRAEIELENAGFSKEDAFALCDYYDESEKQLKTKNKDKEK